jgi:hypothetical protein
MIYNSLPGISAEYKDGGLIVSATNATTGSVLIIGTAEDGPVRKVIGGISVDEAERIFGSAKREGATLVRAMHECYNAGCRDIRLLRATGSIASAKILGPASSRASIKAYTDVFAAASSGNTKLAVSIMDDENFPEGSELYPGSVSVAVDGKTISSSLYSVNYNTGVVAFQKDVIDGGSTVVITYRRIDHTDTAVSNAAMWNSDGEMKVYRTVDGYKDWLDSPAPVIVVAKTDAATTANELVYTITGAHLPILASPAPVVKVGGVVVDDDDYTVNLESGTVTFDSDPDGDVTVDYSYAAAAIDYTLDLAEGKVTFTVALDEADVVKASFTYDKKEIVATNEQGEQLVVTATAAGYNQKFSLKYEPIAQDSERPFKLFVGSKEVPSTGFYVNYEEDEVTLLPGNAPVGQSVYATYYYEDIEDNTPFMVFNSNNGGEIYNEVVIQVSRILDGASETGKSITIIKPFEKRITNAEQNMTFSSIDYPTFGELADAINKHRFNNVLTVLVDTAYRDVLTASIDIPVGENAIQTQLDGGEDGLNHTPDEIYEILGGVKDSDGNVLSPGVYDDLANYRVDKVVVDIPGVYADQELTEAVARRDTSGNIIGYANFAEQLANYCANQALTYSDVRGVISMKPLAPTDNNLAGIRKRVEELLAYENRYYYISANPTNFGHYMVGSDGQRMDIGRYIDVVVGEVYFYVPSIGAYTNTLAITYAGMVSALSLNNSATNKLISSARSPYLKYEFSTKQILDLLNNRYVVPVIKQNRGAVIVEAVTAALPGSDYRLESTMRITSGTLRLMREAADPFIGGPNSPADRAALGTAIENILQALVDENVLQDYHYNIVCTTLDQVMRNVYVDLVLVPVFETRNIRLRAALRPSL